MRCNDLIPLYKRSRHLFGARTQYDFVFYGLRFFEFVYFLDRSGLATVPQFLFGHFSVKNLEQRIAEINAINDLYEMFRDKPEQFQINTERKCNLAWAPL